MQHSDVSGHRNSPSARKPSVSARTSLGTLCAAAQLADIAWPVFLLFGWELSIVGGPNPFLTLAFDSYPISHGLLALVAWGILFALLYRMRTGYACGALVVASLVASHWLLDFVTHVADMPLYPGSPKVGLGLWNWPARLVMGLLPHVPTLWKVGGMPGAGCAGERSKPGEILPAYTPPC